MYRWILTLAATATLGLTPAWGQTTLNVGDLRFVGMNTAAPDGFSFVLTRDITANTVIKFTDGGFNNLAGTTFRGTENFLAIRFNGAASAGTLVRVTDAPTLTASAGYSGGFSTSGNLDGISASGDQLFAYQGANFTANATPTATLFNVGALANDTSFGGSLIYGTSNRTWLTTGTTSSNTSYLPPGLSSNDNNLLFDGANNFQYAGERTGLTNAFQKVALSNSSNFTSNLNNITLSTTGFDFTTSADLFWDNNGTTAGTGGMGTWDTTTGNRFKNAPTDGGSTTYARWIDRSADNEHTAVFAGTAGAVTVSGTVVPSKIRFETTGYNLTGGTINLTAAAPTITVNTGTATIASTITGSNGFTKQGSGTLVVSGANTYSGGTAVQAGTLQLGAANAIPTAGGLLLSNSGTLSSGATTGFNNTFGTLLLSNTPTIALGTGDHTLTFSTLTDLGATLTVNGWTGTLETSGTGGKLVFTGLGSDPAAANLSFATFLSNVSFTGFGSGTFIASGANLELVPVPEPATVLTLGAGVLALGGVVRRRRAKSLACQQRA